MPYFFSHWQEPTMKIEQKIGKSGIIHFKNNDSISNVVFTDQIFFTKKNCIIDVVIQNSNVPRFLTAHLRKVERVQSANHEKWKISMKMKMGFCQLCVNRKVGLLKSWQL